MFFFYTEEGSPPKQPILVHMCSVGTHVKAIRQRQGDALSNVCWETLGPPIHVDVTMTCKACVSIIADHVHPFLCGCGLRISAGYVRFRGLVESMPQIYWCI